MKLNINPGAKWNADLKKSKNVRTFGDVSGTGANWKQEERNRKAKERRDKRAAKQARRSR